jgi:CPA1 family monovalent cation:H+ antiporter
MTFGAVIVSILVQGLTMGPLLKALKLVHARSERGQYEMERGAQQAATQALASLDVMAREAQAHPDVIATLRADYEALRDAAAARIADLHLKTSELQEEELHATWRTLLLGEKDTVLRMLRTGSISGDAAEHLLRDIDARLVALEDTLGDSSGH